MEFETTMDAYVSKYGPTPEELAAGTGISGLNIFRTSTTPDDYFSKVGTARVIVTMMTPDEMIAAKVASLRGALQKDLAESEVRQNGIRDQIQNLLAITSEVRS